MKAENVVTFGLLGVLIASLVLLVVTKNPLLAIPMVTAFFLLGYVRQDAKKRRGAP